MESYQRTKERSIQGSASQSYYAQFSGLAFHRGIQSFFIFFGLLLIAYDLESRNWTSTERQDEPDFNYKELKSPDSLKATPSS